MTDMQIVFATVAVAIVLFASGRVRLDIVAMLVVMTMMLSGVLTPGEALAGFGDPVVLLVASLLVVGEMLDRTGVAQSIGAWIIRRGGQSESRLLVLIMLAAAALSSVMSSTAVVAIFIPIVFKVAAKSGLNASRMLLPMSYAAMISGMLTLIATTPNLVVSSELAGNGFEPLGFFSFFPIGLVVLVVGVVYTLLLGRRLLAGQDVETPDAGRSLADIGGDFQLDERIGRIRVPAASPLAGKSIGEAQLESRYGLRVLVLESPPRGFRDQGRSTTADADDLIQPGDVLLVVGKPDAIERLPETEQVDILPDSEADQQRLLHEHGAAVVLIHPQVVGGLGAAGPYAMMTLLFFLTAGLSLFLSNTASAVLIAPVAVQAAEALDVSPYPLAVTVLIGASAAFASPVASPVVTLVVEPGRYRFLDFVKVGAPLMLLAYLVTMLVTPLVFPL